MFAAGLRKIFLQEMSRPPLSRGLRRRRLLPKCPAMRHLVAGLGVRGKFIVIGVTDDPIQLSASPLVFGGRSIYGSLAGTAIDNEDTLAFSVLERIRPMIETLPLEQATDAYARMMQGKARFRMVLVTG